jgi:hypothetical protein
VDRQATVTYRVSHFRTDRTLRSLNTCLLREEIQRTVNKRVWLTNAVAMPVRTQP